MKTFKSAALLMLMLTLGWTVVVHSQTPTQETGAKVATGPADHGPGVPSWRECSVSLQIDVAWDPKQLPLTDDDLASFANSARDSAIGGIPGAIKITYEAIPLPTIPATTSAPAGPGVKANWHAVRFTATGERRIGRGFENELILRQSLGASGMDFFNRTEDWLRNLQLLSSDSYQQLDQEVRELRILHVDETTAQIKQEKERMRALMIDVQAKEARMSALTRAITDLTKQAEMKAAEDPILRELEKIRVLREAQVKEAQKLLAAGQMNQTDFSQAEVSLLEATVKVAQRKEAVASAASADLLPKLTGEHMMLRIDDEEIGFRLVEIRAEIDKLEKPARERAIKLEAARKRLKAEQCWVILAAPEPKVQEIK